MAVVSSRIYHHNADEIGVFGNNHHVACKKHLIDLMACLVHYSLDHNIGNRVNMALDTFPLYFSNLVILYVPFPSHEKDSYHREKVDLSSCED